MKHVYYLGLGISALSFSLWVAVCSDCGGGGDLNSRVLWIESKHKSSLLWSECRWNFWGWGSLGLLWYVGQYTRIWHWTLFSVSRVGEGFGRNGRRGRFRRDRRRVWNRVYFWGVPSSRGGSGDRRNVIFEYIKQPSLRNSMPYPCLWGSPSIQPRLLCSQIFQATVVELSNISWGAQSATCLQQLLTDFTS